MSDNAWQRWYDSLTRRQRLRHRIDRKLSTWDNWLATRETHLTDHDWLYIGPPDGWLVKPMCLLFGHEFEGIGGFRLCIHCGRRWL